MMSSPLSLHWSTADDTARAGAALASVLCAGDVVLLIGDVGAGKTHFARALIQSILPEPEDVPSPTFTLVQVYDTTRGPVWHADLYRITSDQEIDELGLSDAFDDAICLVEWPDRLGPIAPDNALSIPIAAPEEGRVAMLTWSDTRWAARLNQVIADV